MKIKQIKTVRKTLLLVLLIVLLIGGSIFVYAQTRNNDSANSDDVSNQDNINYNPPTKEEKKAADDHKQDIIDKDNQEGQPPANATVIISGAGQYEDQIEVRAFVSNIIEVGTCTFIFTKGTASIQRQTEAFADASTTQCQSVSVPRSKFPSAGIWTVTVKYQASITGQAEKAFEVRQP